MKLSLISYIILSLLLYGCIKDDDMCGAPASNSVLANLDSLGLPPATTTGENTFGCLINGEPWLPLKRNVFGTLSYQIDFSIGTVSPGYFTCNMWQNYDSLESILNFLFLDIFTEGNYPSSSMSDGGGGVYQDTDNSYPGAGYDPDLSFEDGGLVITKLDLEEEIISGTFNLRYIDSDLTEPDTLWVTEGRFDLMGN